jgi:hypothetical protein
MEDLRRDPLAIDPRKDAAVAGEPIVLTEYATEIAAILARVNNSQFKESPP